MAKCECCGKGVTFGIKVSHSHRRSNRTWKPNVRARLPALSKSVVYVAGHVWRGRLFCFLSGKRCFLWHCPAIPSCC